MGTALFAVCFLPLGRTGKVLGVVGLVVPIGALTLNFATFPTPPAEAGFVDLGPGIALWYVAAAVLMLSDARTNEMMAYP